ncbi:hypothetical protein [Streptomyces sp. NPDC090798]|uniref:hypothetical protein n=1 Tax=Streptomyces sp. NPDC090798 TaxID=3365968 RepID=UPI00382F42F4
MSGLAWCIVLVTAWMSWSVWRMDVLPAWWRRLPMLLLAAGVAGVVSASEQMFGTPADRIVAGSSLVLVLAAWAVSLGERRRQGTGRH